MGGPGQHWKGPIYEWSSGDVYTARTPRGRLVFRWTAACAVWFGSVDRTSFSGNLGGAITYNSYTMTQRAHQLFARGGFKLQSGADKSAASGRCWAQEVRHALSNRPIGFRHPDGLISHAKNMQYVQVKPLALLRPGLNSSGS
jgi:hypothetical protein